MPNKLPPMKLSHDEELYLRHWICDEWRYQEGQGPAKQLQVQHHASPADLAILVAAAIPDPTEQQKIALSDPPADSPRWPWSQTTLNERVVEARSLLARRKGVGTSPRPTIQSSYEKE